MSDGKQPEENWTWSWDEHELEQLRHGARLTLADKLAWLEEVHEVGLNLQRSCRSADSTDSEPGEGVPCESHLK